MDDKQYLKLAIDQAGKSVSAGASAVTSRAEAGILVTVQTSDTIFVIASVAKQSLDLPAGKAGIATATSQPRDDGVISEV